MSLRSSAGKEVGDNVWLGVRHLFADVVLQAIKDYRDFGGDYKNVKKWLLEEAPLWYEAAGAEIDPEVWGKWIEDGCPDAT